MVVDFYKDEKMYARVRLLWASGEMMKIESGSIMLDVFKTFKYRVEIINFEVEFLPMNVEYPECYEVHTSQYVSTHEDNFTQLELELTPTPTSQS